MTITPSLFEAFLKCPTKCWLRFTGEPRTSNTYAEWVQSEHESYRADAAKRLIANAPAGSSTTSSPSLGKIQGQAHESVAVACRFVRGSKKTILFCPVPVPVAEFQN